MPIQNIFHKTVDLNLPAEIVQATVCTTTI